MKICSEDYCKLRDWLREIENTDPEWMPTEEDLKKHVYLSPEKYLLFFIWLEETCIVKESNKIVCQEINYVLRENIEITK